MSELTHAGGKGESFCDVREAATDSPLPQTTEFDRRVYYQDLVYAACNTLDRLLKLRICCGTVDSPTSEFRDALKLLTDRFMELAAEHAATMPIYSPPTDAARELAREISEHPVPLWDCDEHDMQTLIAILSRRRSERVERLEKALKAISSRCDGFNSSFQRTIWDIAKLAREALAAEGKETPMQPTLVTGKETIIEKSKRCKLCDAPFRCDNGMWFTTCDCARTRPVELAAAQKEWDKASLALTPDGNGDTNLRRAWQPAMAVGDMRDDKPQPAALLHMDNDCRLEAKSAEPVTAGETASSSPSPSEQVKELRELGRRIAASNYNYANADQICESAAATIERLEGEVRRWKIERDVSREMLRQRTNTVESLQSQLDAAVKERDALVMAVAKVTPGETRYESALRIIRGHEDRPVEGAAKESHP